MFQHSCSDNSFSDSVRITVWRWSSIFKVTFAIFSTLPRNAHARASIGHAMGEVVNWWCLMVPGQSSPVVFSFIGVVHSDVVVVSVRQPLDGFVYVLHSAFFSHRLRAERHVRRTMLVFLTISLKSQLRYICICIYAMGVKIRDGSLVNFGSFRPSCMIFLVK